MNSKELFEQISGLYETAKVNHEDKTKKAHAAARKALSQMKKVIQAYNKASSAEAKAK